MQGYMRLYMAWNWVSVNKTGKKTGHHAISFPFWCNSMTEFGEEKRRESMVPLQGREQHAMHYGCCWEAKWRSNIIPIFTHSFCHNLAAESIFFPLFLTFLWIANTFTQTARSTTDLINGGSFFAHASMRSASSSS